MTIIHSLFQKLEFALSLLQENHTLIKMNTQFWGGKINTLNTLQEWNFNFKYN